MRLRNALYLAAVSSARCHHLPSPFYARLCAADKPAKVALTAVMRKLIQSLNHLLKHPDFPLSPKPAP